MTCRLSLAPLSFVVCLGCQAADNASSGVAPPSGSLPVGDPGPGAPSAGDDRPPPPGDLHSGGGDSSGGGDVDVPGDAQSAGDLGPAESYTTADINRIVTHAYRGILGRDPDPEGLGVYAAYLGSGNTVLSFCQILYDSEEYGIFRAPLAVSALAGELYTGILGRTASAAELAAASSDITGGQGPAHANALLTGTEFRDRFLTPGPIDLGTLRASGSGFVDDSGAPVYLAGAVICCEDAKSRGWPLVDHATLEQLAVHHANFTHVRIGPNTVESEGPNHVAYEPVGSNVVDLDQWHGPYWQRLRSLVQFAGEHSIYVEISLIDAWVLERPELSAWGPGNNVNGVSAGDCGILSAAPQPVHARWLRKVVEEVGQFPNVMFEIGNETFDCGGTLQPAWSIGVATIVRDELMARGFGDRPIGTNSHAPAIEADPTIDYVNRHGGVQSVRSGKPTLVNEYGDTFTAQQYDDRLREAHGLGTSFHLWRMWQDEPTFVASLERIAAFQIDIGAASGPTTPGEGCGEPAMAECGGPEGPPGTWGCCVTAGGNTDQYGGIVNAAIDKIRAEQPSLFDGVNVLDEDAYVQGVAAIIERDDGLCAKQGGPADEIGVKATNSFNEQYDIMFGSGQVRYDGHVVTCTPARF